LREAQFIKINRERWVQIQQQPSENADETAEEFTQLVEDLGYSKTFYPTSRTTDFLNKEASKRYLRIYENSKTNKGKLWLIFKERIPLTLYKHRWIVYGCFLAFILFVLIGAYSAKNDPQFIEDILGKSYIQMTEDNIKKGNPFGVYNSGNSLIMFLGIFVNNILVALRLFAGGILLGYPTIQGLVFNSIMVGAFYELFAQNNLSEGFFLTVMIHGTVELSSIALAAASGLVLAKSWLFPGTGTRLKALKEGAKDGLLIALTNFPMLLLAGFFEGFITRYEHMHAGFKLLFIIPSLLIVVGYFIVYPLRVNAHLRKRNNNETAIQQVVSKEVVDA
jgi:uncharacterized membrane protein SpoIIM required for sporulation